MSSSTAGPSRQPTKPPVVQPGSGNAIIINPCQRLNPLLECIRNVNKEFGDVVPDFQLGRTTCALYLSLKYHRLHPEYIHQRIQKLGNLYNLRLLLLMCDVSEHQEPIRELTKICLINNITIIVCWSNEEAGTYLATYKAFEHRPPDLIKERVDKEYNAMLRSALTSINKVNKTDVESLRTSFGSFAKIAHASPDQLRRLPGFGQVKVRRVIDTFDKPFRNKATSALPSQTQLQLQSNTAEQDEQELHASEQPNGGARTPKDSTQSQNAKTPTTRRVHEFGSAADMRTPPASAGRTDSAAARAPSPVWDIELDLNEDDLGDAPLLVDPRLAKKGKMPDEEARDDNAGVKENREPQTQKTQDRPQRQRSPSPVWDIELDLNDDDL